MKTFNEWLETNRVRPSIPRARVRVIGDVHNFVYKPGPPGYSYMDLVEQAEYSVQVGDMGGEHDGMYSVGVNGGGYNYSPLSRLDPKKHVFIGGNHDNYDSLPSHHLGDYGVYQFPGFRFFYIRGAWSVNWRSARLMSAKDKRWWPEEEIDETQVGPALKAYLQERPEIVITHDVPTEILETLKGGSDKKEKYAQSSLRQAERIRRQLSQQNVQNVPSDDDIPQYLKNVEAGQPSRTNSLLQKVFESWRPKTWLFGHHHTDWGQMIGGVQFVGLGLLSYMDF